MGGQATAQTVTGLQTNTYYVTLTDSKGCTDNDTTVVYNENSDLQLTVSGDTAICEGDTANITIIAQGSNIPFSYTWNPIPPNPLPPYTPISLYPLSTTTYTITVTDTASCTQTANIIITVDPPVTATAQKDTTYCKGDVDSLTITAAGGSTYSWSSNPPGFSSSQQSTIINPPSTSTTYTVIVSNNSCSDTANITITVYPYPTADFTYTPQAPSLLNPSVIFKDQSQNAVTWQWDFGDQQGTSTDQNPVYSFNEIGKYLIQLIVENSQGCSDSINHWLEIICASTFYVPNAFTPNADGINETFMPTGISECYQSFRLYIYDRWGNFIYKTDDVNPPAGGWDGKANDGKRIAQMDTYIWMVKLIDFNGEDQKYIGHVNLLR